MFHTQNNLFFEKLPDGGVKVIKRCHCLSETCQYHIEQTLTADMWASVIASMSYYGEEDYGWYRAKNFHQGTPVPESCPLVQKQPAG